jgi:hypothetical protein
MKLQHFLLDELEDSKINPGLTLHGETYDNDLYVSMKAFWNLFAGEITLEYTCTSCKSTIETPESINYLLLHFPDEKDKKCDTVQSLIEFNLQEHDIKEYYCRGCQKNTSATSKSSITKFPSFMCILLCCSRGDSNGTITSAVEFPALGFDIKGDQMPYDLYATVHHKPTKDGKGHYLGCAFRFVFRFIPVLIFRNSGYSAEFPGSVGTHVGIKSFQGKINLLRNSGSGIPDPEFLREGPMTWCILCHVKRTFSKKNKKNRCQRWHSAAAAAPHTAASRYCCRHCCHCLSRGSSGGAGVAACGGGSGSSSSVGSGGGSGAILFLVVVVVLLLSPRWHRPSPFRR